MREIEDENVAKMWGGPAADQLDCWTNFQKSSACIYLFFIYRRKHLYIDTTYGRYAYNYFIICNACVLFVSGILSFVIYAATDVKKFGFGGLIYFQGPQ